ncbi:MAG: hypothetical protein PHY56_00175 [Candidatus Omnitrophica bacterium]|nr:hypothetical protein [Candidatus Omnitrophota bacterium]
MSIVRGYGGAINKVKTKFNVGDRVRLKTTIHEGIIKEIIPAMVMEYLVEYDHMIPTYEKEYHIEKVKVKKFLSFYKKMFGVKK